VELYARVVVLFCDKIFYNYYVLPNEMMILESIPWYFGNKWYCYHFW